MLRVGLTGGIGCGKTTVAEMLQELGCYVLSADELAHQLTEPGQPAYDEIRSAFGEAILDSSGRIDRKRLAAVVFADPEKLAKLNAIVHPRVLLEEDRQLDRLERADPRAIGVVEAALLIESGYYRRLDRLIVVWCRREQQLERLIAPAFGRQMSREDAERRIASQLDIDQKRRLADDVIDTSGTLEETRGQVEALVQRLKGMAVQGKS